MARFRKTGLDVDVDTRGLRDLTLLNPRDAKRVIAKGLSDTARTGRTKAARHIGREYSIPSTPTRERLRTKRARRNDLQAGIVAYGQPLTLRKGAKNIRQTKKGVKAHAFGERQLYSGTFLATMASGHKGIFKRATDRGGRRVARLPIRELYGPSVPDALDHVNRHTSLPSDLSADAVSKISRQIDRELRRQAGKHRS